MPMEISAAPVSTGEGSNDHSVHHRDRNTQSVHDQRGKELAQNKREQVNGRGQQCLSRFILTVLTEKPHGKNRDQQHNDGEHPVKHVAQAGGVAVKNAEEEISGEYIEHRQINISDRGRKIGGKLPLQNGKH